MNGLCLILLICKMEIIVPPSEGCVRMKRENTGLEQHLLSASSITILVFTIVTLVAIVTIMSPAAAAHLSIHTH